MQIPSQAPSLKEILDRFLTSLQHSAYWIIRLTNPRKSIGGGLDIYLPHLKRSDRQGEVTGPNPIRFCQRLLLNQSPSPPPNVGQVSKLASKHASQIQGEPSASPAYHPKVQSAPRVNGFCNVPFESRHCTCSALNMQDLPLRGSPTRDWSISYAALPLGFKSSVECEPLPFRKASHALLPFPLLCELT